MLGSRQLVQSRTPSLLERIGSLQQKHVHIHINQTCLKNSVSMQSATGGGSKLHAYLARTEEHEADGRDPTIVPSV